MKKSGPTNYQKQLKGTTKNNGPNSNRDVSAQSKERTQQRKDGDEIDLKFGFERFTEVIEIK